MGGTSCDTFLLAEGGGESELTVDRRVAGLPVRLPMVDIHTVSAGGGSIAWVDSGGALRVGPQSAGADPGPACYGRGGTQPTVTDANLVLGRVDPSWFAGGQMRLDVDAARRAVGLLAHELELGTSDLAEGICDVINAKMAQAIRTLTVEKGIEPGDFALVAFGGAGPMHAAFLARELDIDEVLAPRFPGAFSAWGMLETEIRKDFSRAYFTQLSDLDHNDLASILAKQEQEAFDALREEGIAEATGHVEHFVDIRYVGQEYTLTIALESAAEPLSGDFGRALAHRFDTAHETRFGHANPGAPIELVAVRSTALGDLGRAEPQHFDPVADVTYAYDERPIVFDRREQTARIVRRGDLPPGAVVEGPAVVVEETATTVVPPESVMRVDGFGTLVIAIGEEEL
jgi:N-methylhydantoinase A